METTTNPFETLRITAGLDTDGAFAVRSVGMFGHFNTVGFTSDPLAAIKAAEMLNADHAVVGETFQAVAV